MAGHFHSDEDENSSLNHIIRNLERLLSPSHDRATSIESASSGETSPHKALITSSPVPLELRQNNPQDCSNLIIASVNRATVEISRTIIALNATFSQQLQQASISASNGIKSAQSSASSTINVVVQSASVATVAAFSSVTVANLAVTSATSALSNVQSSASTALSIANQSIAAATSSLTLANLALGSAQATITSVNSDLTSVSSASSSDVSRLSASIILLQASVSSVQVRSQLRKENHYPRFHVYLQSMIGLSRSSPGSGSVGTGFSHWLSSCPGLLNSCFRSLCDTDVAKRTNSPCWFVIKQRKCWIITIVSDLTRSLGPTLSITTPQNNIIHTWPGSRGHNCSGGCVYSYECLCILSNHQVKEEERTRQLSR
jgi:hypothetical protein